MTVALSPAAFPAVPVSAEVRQTIGVRTEHVRIRKGKGNGSGNATTGAPVARVRWIEHLGDQSHLHVRVNDKADVVTLVDPDTDLTVGDEVHIEMLAPLFFDAGGDRVRP